MRGGLRPATVRQVRVREVRMREVRVVDLVRVHLLERRYVRLLDRQVGDGGQDRSEEDVARRGSAEA